ncbi:MAG: BBE domain-containing protein [Egibacteraceae bacterium]
MTTASAPRTAPTSTAFEVKKTYDPDNLFRSNRNIRPQAE